MNSFQIRELAKTQKVAFKKHALIRMVERRIPVDEVIVALSMCEVIQNYREDKPHPSCLVLGFVHAKPIHAVVAVDDERLWVITVYLPSAEIWNSDFRTRKNKE